jgi:hypothetical protein
MVTTFFETFNMWKNCLLKCYMFFFIVECRILLYVLCDARADGNLWMVIIVVSN